jgi:hypothetical protein
MSIQLLGNHTHMLGGLLPGLGTGIESAWVLACMMSGAVHCKLNLRNTESQIMQFVGTAGFSMDNGVGKPMFVCLKLMGHVETIQLILNGSFTCLSSVTPPPMSRV